MATFHHGAGSTQAAGSKFYLDGFDATCFVTEVNASFDIDNAEVTTLCQDAKQYIPGLEDGTVSISGFYDTATPDTSTFHYKAEALRREITNYVYLPVGDAQDVEAYFGKAVMSSFEFGSTTDDAVSMDMEFQGSNAIHTGITLKASSSVTASGNSTPVDQTAGSTDGGVAVLSVKSVSGTTPTLDVKVQTSTTSGGVYTDLITFSQMNATGSQYIEVAGTVNQFVRVLWTVGGTSPNFNFHVAWKRN